MRYAVHVSIETLAPMRVACYRAASLSPEEDGAKYMLEWWRRQGGGAPGRHFGFDVDVTPEQQKEGLRGYEIWLVVPEDFVLFGRAGLFLGGGDAVRFRGRAVCGADAVRSVRGPVWAHSGGLEGAARVGDGEESSHCRTAGNTSGWRSWWRAPTGTT